MVQSGTILALGISPHHRHINRTVLLSDAGVRAHLCPVVSHGASCERAWCGFLKHGSSVPGDHIARKSTVAYRGLLGPELQRS